MVGSVEIIWSWLDILHCDPLVKLDKFSFLGGGDLFSGLTGGKNGDGTAFGNNFCVTTFV